MPSKIGEPIRARRIPPGPHWTQKQIQQLFLKDPVGLYRSLARKYGGLVHLEIQNKHLFIANDPEYIREVFVLKHKNFAKDQGLEAIPEILGNGLLTSEDGFHHQQRRVIQPAFYNTHLSSYLPVFADYTAKIMARWRDGDVIDVDFEVRRLLLNAVTRSLFGLDKHKDIDRIVHSFSVLLEQISAETDPLEIFLDQNSSHRTKQYYSEWVVCR